MQGELFGCEQILEATGLPAVAKTGVGGSSLPVCGKKIREF